MILVLPSVCATLIFLSISLDFIVLFSSNISTVSISRPFSQCEVDHLVFIVLLL